MKVSAGPKIMNVFKLIYGSYTVFFHAALRNPSLPFLFKVSYAQNSQFRSWIVSCLSPSNSKIDQRNELAMNLRIIVHHESLNTF